MHNTSAMKFLDSIRSKPVHVRKRILFVSTGVIFFFIATIWWNTWSIAGTGAATVALKEKTPVDTIAGMWGEAKRDITRSWNQMVQGPEYTANMNAIIASTTADDSDPNGEVYPEDVFADHIYATGTEVQATTTQ